MPSEARTIITRRPDLHRSATARPRMGVGASTHPALERALRLFAEQAPALARRAQASLDVLLEGIRTSLWPQVAWEYSRLTGDGFPVEFSFSSADEAIRYTAEVAGPELPESERLLAAERVLARLGAGRFPEAVRSLFHQVQQSGTLLYGVWVGARHREDGDRYKLYLEVPRPGGAAESLVHRLVGSEPLLPGHVPALQMIGYEPGSSRFELYFRSDRLEPWEVGLLLRRAGLAGREDELLSLVEEAYGRSIQAGLPGSDLGFSLAISPVAQPTVFSLFHYAGSVFGGDGSIRRRVLALAKTRAWRLGVYEELSEPLAEGQSWMTQHTMVTFAVASDGPPVLCLGVRPPEGRLRGSY